MALSANSDLKLTPNPDEDPQADTARSSTGPFTRLIFILLGAAVILGGLWIGLGDQIMGMVTGGGNGDVPTISADNAPIKVRPEQPGGMQVPNQGRLVYGVVDGSATQPRMERLLPSPEKPVEVENVLTRGVPETNAVVAGSAPRGTADQPMAPAVPSAADVATLTAPPPPPAAPTASGAPRVLAPPSATKTVTTPNKTITAPMPETIPAPVPTLIPETGPAAVAAPAAPVAPAPQVAKPAAKPAATTVASAPAASAPSSTGADLNGSYRVQLAAARSEDAITSEWNRLKSRNTDLLGDLQLQITKVDLGATKGIFYRMRLGPLENEVAAKALCERLKQRKLGCLVIKPGG